MTNSITSQATHAGSSSYSSNAVCPTRKNLLDRLAGAVMGLGIAKLSLFNSIESGDLTPGDSVRTEVERLRDDCSAIRLELESHRARHGC